MNDPQQTSPSSPITGSLLALAPSVQVPQSAMRIQFSRSGGPGGQNVNKLNTRAQLWVPLDAILGMTESAMTRLRRLAGQRLTAAGELHLIAETERTQEGNREAVMERLRLLIAQALVQPRRRRKTKPTRASQRRRVESKKKRGEVKSQRRYRGE